uniref:Uncharacterized protein n=1 Tax=Ditylenchus dipsaci TaxID=166011 RepID=A0A915ECL6_9BILA
MNYDAGEDIGNKPCTVLAYRMSDTVTEAMLRFAFGLRLRLPKQYRRSSRGLKVSGKNIHDEYGADHGEIKFKILRFASRNIPPSKTVHLAGLPTTATKTEVVSWLASLGVHAASLANRISGDGFRTLWLTFAKKVDAGYAATCLMGSPTMVRSSCFFAYQDTKNSEQNWCRVIGRWLHLDTVWVIQRTLSFIAFVSVKVSCSVQKRISSVLQANIPEKKCAANRSVLQSSAVHWMVFLALLFSSIGGINATPILQSASETMANTESGYPLDLARLEIMLFVVDDGDKLAFTLFRPKCLEDDEMSKDKGVAMFSISTDYRLIKVDGSQVQNSDGNGYLANVSLTGTPDCEFKALFKYNPLDESKQPSPNDVQSSASNSLSTLAIVGIVLGVVGLLALLSLIGLLLYCYL